MNEIIKIFSKKELAIYENYFLYKHRYESNLGDHQAKYNSHKYGDHLAECLLASLVSVIEDKTNLSLYPTYSMYRIYTYGESLFEHTDRPECEISVSINIGSSGEDWPLIIEKKEYNLKPGEGVIYKGTEQKHGRNNFKGDFHIQLLLHFVNKNGPYANKIFDGRPALGCDKLERK